MLNACQVGMALKSLVLFKIGRIHYSMFKADNIVKNRIHHVFSVWCLVFDMKFIIL